MFSDRLKVEFNDLRKLRLSLILSFHFSMISKALNNVGVLSTDILNGRKEVFLFFMEIKTRIRENVNQPRVTIFKFTIHMIILGIY